MDPVNLILLSKQVPSYEIELSLCRESHETLFYLKPYISMTTIMDWENLHI